jgi:hypothetical protein
MNNGVGIWVQRDAESEDRADFAVTGTYDRSSIMLGSQQYEVELKTSVRLTERLPITTASLKSPLPCWEQQSVSKHMFALWCSKQ